ncbi:SUMF1/EgtB/PvdO family nonheme iron enzyme [Accumulibacter sp.]|uniref:formylglycine-generating enzyme family protein n=1 Tax=Accumulibacter sp. TaxID=2053492 RepID=UPI002CCE9A74|nr:SUMF1/EgtB/PvdO family nonheme iron enzyme [Accumulibacter sp.]HRF05112.1 SUMF1/EgtB/PvdO family nonheme iron enzyme [Accumulibacter sp.]
MSWLQPSAFEQELVADVRARWPEIVPLARLLSLAMRIEPLLLRNARLHFLPGSATEIESLLWFSPLIGARSSSEVILHAGVARLLADELRAEQPLFNEVRSFIARHSRHWSPEDRLEQDLRLEALLDHQLAVQQGLQDMLKRIHDEGDEEQRIRLARWSRRSLASVGGAESRLAEARLLTQYASCSLGASSGLAAGNSAPPATLPDWLKDKLPAPFRPARLAVSLHWEAGKPQVLHCRAATGSEPAIELSTPLPASLHVQCAGNDSGTWHVVGTDTRIALPLIAERVLLTTIDGRRYELLAELPAEVAAAEAAAAPPPLYLSHLAADREQARSIADWLSRQGIRLQLIEEESLDSAAAAAADEGQGEALRVLRLWTRAAQAHWAEKTGSDALPGPRAALLRTEALAAPPPGQGAEQLLDLLDWQQPEKSEEARNFLEQLRAWLADEQPPPEPDEAKVGEGGEVGSEAEALLAELADPKTPPPRRLAIGDRLAEIGDPRPGVGVREFVRRDAPPRVAEAPAEASPPQVDQLLDELEAIETPPPRRLAIGDRLAEIGDPRPGVGLDDRGLPALDWVEIPGGEFVYQEGEKRRLPTFYIARYPVTNAQYQAFIDAGGYKRKSWWQVGEYKSGWWPDLKQPKLDQSLWPQANRPRTHVDWYEAVAFSRWLSAQLSYEIRLPTEEEWERAARGREGHEYPWGDSYRTGYANINERIAKVKAGKWYLAQTTAVGIYPHAASAEGVLDLTGNVWEWCLNKYERPKDAEADTSGDGRVLRGGSWSASPVGARSARRSSNEPVKRNAYRGFRLVTSARSRYTQLI